MFDFGEEKNMFDRRASAIGLKLLVVFAAVNGGQVTQAAQQIDKPAQAPAVTAQSAPISNGATASSAVRAVVDPVTGKLVDPNAPPVSPRDNPNRIDPELVMPAPNLNSPAPGLPGGVMARGKFGPDGKAVVARGKVGPDGKAIAKDSRKSPHGFRPSVDKETERLGPDGKLGTAAKPSQSTATVAQVSAAQSEPKAKEVSAKAPAAGAGLVVFTDPVTGEIVEPTKAQLAEHALSRPANGYREEQLNLRAGPDGSTVADVPRSLRPMLEATVGPDGKVTVRHVHSTSPDAGQGEVGLGRQAGHEMGTAAKGSLGPDAKQGVGLLPQPKALIPIINNDGANEGFNDPTPAAPVFGNPGTTVGAQRLNAFQAAADFWGGILKSNTAIQIQAEMNPLTPCSTNSGVLGSAGPTTTHQNFTNAPAANTWYVQAVANSLAGGDQSGQPDITAEFNSSVGTAGCLSGGWWYGIGAPPPAGQSDFFSTALHEIGHGIGVLSLVDSDNGSKMGGIDDAYMRYLWDWTLNKSWKDMTNAERLASQVNTGNVVFYGPNTVEASRGLLTAGTNSNYPRIYAPNPVEGGSSISHFDTAVIPNELMEPLLTPPPGPYAYLTSGLLQDIGWKLLSRGIFDFGGNGTYTWSSTDGWFQPTAADPSTLVGWDGNFVGGYPIGTWLWNGTRGVWSQLSAAIPESMKACGNNLMWESALGTWRWNVASGWLQLTGANPDSIECFGGNLVWEGSIGTWIYNVSTGSWTQITGLDPTGIMACGANLVWWQPTSTWIWNATTGWAQITGVGPESAACWRGNIAWEGAIGTWIYDVTAGTWAQITAANPGSMAAWGPNLVWGGAIGTWVYSSAGTWTQITTLNPTRLATLGAQLLWTGTGNGTWVWNGGGGGLAWTQITGLDAGMIVTTGAVP